VVGLLASSKVAPLPNALMTTSPPAAVSCTEMRAADRVAVTEDAIARFGHLLRGDELKHLSNAVPR